MLAVAAFGLYSRYQPRLVYYSGQLAAYIERCTARPAFQRALQAQMVDFREGEAA